jgi:hypothetical protein
MLGCVALGATIRLIIALPGIALCRAPPCDGGLSRPQVYSDDVFSGGSGGIVSVAGVCRCMICASKGAKSLATFHVVRCGDVRFCTTLHVETTLFNLNGVQGVAGSNPAVPT